MSAKRQFFGTDGIRAVANRHPMSPEFVMRLGQAAAVVLGGATGDSGLRPKCVMGRDTRASGEMLEAAICAGLNSAGVDVILVGVLPTPAIAFLTRQLGGDFGIIVSASHNPFYDNGVKFVRGDGSKLNDKTESAIEDIILGRGDYSEPRPEGRGLGRVSRFGDGLERYVAHALG